MHRDEYWAQPQPEVKTVACICGYTTPADKDGLRILRWHQQSCRKFRGLPPEEVPKDDPSWKVK